ncbi:MAG TPA: hypothetical protein PLZ46_03325, partial [Bacteroidales bacterium]|nr:hypothetical protein [Bacteroidales bacterium]HQA86222.1 hypothetical protein [Bacteroidales bacterium]
AALRPHGLCPRTWNRAPTRERQRTGHAQIKIKTIFIFLLLVILAFFNNCRKYLKFLLFFKK